MPDQDRKLRTPSFQEAEYAQVRSGKVAENTQLKRTENAQLGLGNDSEGPEPKPT